VSFIEVGLRDAGVSQGLARGDRPVREGMSGGRKGEERGMEWGGRLRRGKEKGERRGEVERERRREGGGSIDESRQMEENGPRTVGNGGTKKGLQKGTGGRDGRWRGGRV